MNLIRKCFFTLIILGFVYEGFSQEKTEALKLSISEAQTYALQNNRTIQSAKLDIEIANKRIWETTAIGLPQFNFAVNYQHQFVVPEFSFPTAGFSPSRLTDIEGLQQQEIAPGIWQYYKSGQKISMGVKDNATFDFTVSQLIFSGEYIVGLQAFKVLKQVQEKNLVKTESLTKETVASTYYLALALEENSKVLKASLKLINQTYEDLVKMNQQGFNEETDVDQLKINISNIQTLVNSLESQKEISIKLLKFQLGVDFSQSLVLTDSLPSIILSGNFQYLASPEFNLDNSIDYQMITNLEKVSGLTLKQQQSKFLPTVSAFYRHQEQAKQASFNFAVKDVAGVTLSLPIFTSGQRLAKVSQAKLDLEKSRLNTKTVAQSLILEFESAKSSYQTAFSNYSTNKESMTLSKKIYDKTIIKYREGVSSNFELTQNQNQFLTAESNYYNSLLSLLNAKAKLDRILSLSNN